MAKKKIRYYLCSQLCASANLHDFIKDLAIREPASYRRVKPVDSLTTREKRQGREMVKEKITLKSFVNGEVVDKEVEIVKYDHQSWRYYIECSTLEELNSFFAEVSEVVDLAGLIKYIDGEGFAEGEEFETNIGLEEVPEGSHIIYFNDSFLEEDDDFEFMTENDGEEEGDG